MSKPNTTQGMQAGYRLPPVPVRPEVLKPGLPGSYKARAGYLAPPVTPEINTKIKDNQP